MPNRKRPGSHTRSPSELLMTIPPALRRELQQRYEQVMRLRDQPQADHDRIHGLLSECLIHDPGNPVYVAALLENLQRKHSRQTQRAGFAILGKRRRLLKAHHGQKWQDVLRLGPTVLLTHPRDKATLCALAAACAACEYGEAELHYLRFALHAFPRDADLNRHCARSLARQGQFDEALACWRRVSQCHADDDEARRMIGELSRAEPASSGGAAEGSSPAADRPRPWQVRLAAAGDVPTSRAVEQQLRAAIAGAPSDIDHYLQLADFYCDQQRYDDAEQVLSLATSVSGHVVVHERLEDTMILRMQQQLAIAQRRADQEATADACLLVAEIRSNLDRLELEIFSGRSQRYPTDLELKLQLGIRLKRVGNHSEAIVWLEQAGQSEQLCAQATLEMGECWQYRRQFDRALACYERAVQHAERTQQERWLELACYRAGVLAAGLQQLETARKHLSRLTSRDPAYRDAQRRLDKLEQIRHKQ